MDMRISSLAKATTLFADFAAVMTGYLSFLIEDDDASLNFIYLFGFSSAMLFCCLSLLSRIFGGFLTDVLMIIYSSVDLMSTAAFLSELDFLSRPYSTTGGPKPLLFCLC